MFLLFCFLLGCHCEESSVNDFPLQDFATTGPDLPKATQVVVRVASITQDIAAV
jgi:hypothetical protein